MYKKCQPWYILSRYVKLKMNYLWFENGYIFDSIFLVFRSDFCLAKYSARYKTTHFNKIYKVRLYFIFEI